MKKILFIILLCFVAMFAMGAINESPHPGDSIESVFIAQDVVVISQAVMAPADMLYLKQININNSNENETCLPVYDTVSVIPTLKIREYDTYGLTVAYIGFEMGYDNLYKPGEDVAIYCMEYG